MKKISQIIPFGPKPSNFGPNDVFSEVLFSKFRETSEKLVTSHRLQRTKETQITQKTISILILDEDSQVDHFNAKSPSQSTF